MSLLCLSVLEARIQQLQSDVILDVQHAKVQFVSAPSSGTGTSSVKCPKIQAQAKPDQLKSGNSIAKSSSKSQPSRWMEKLSQEKKNKLKKEQNLQQKIQKKVKDAQVSIGSQMLPGTSCKTISTAAKKKKTGRLKLSDKIRAAMSLNVTSTTAAGTTALSQKVSKGNKNRLKNPTLTEHVQKHRISGAKGRAEVLTEAEELEKRLNQKLSQWTSSNTEAVQDNDTCTDIQQSIHSYLEACVFAGEIERANRFLLSQHRVMSRRKHLNTDIYNIMMRVWAKKVRW